MITMSLYQLVDAFWLGKLGYQAIAALTVVMPYFVFVIAMGVGSGVGANALASRRFGEGNVEATNQVAGQVFLLAGLLGTLTMIAAVFFAEPILTICGATPDIMGLATQYLVVLGYGTPFFIFRMITGNLFRASGDAVRPMVFAIVGTVVNVILDPFLIFGWGPFPEMGVSGAALATVIASVLSAALSFYYFIGRKSVYRLKLSHLIPSLPIIRDIYRVGFPSMLMQMMESVVFALFNYVLSGFGSVALAAVGIIGRIMDLAFMPMVGVHQGLLPIVGFCFGARLWDRLWHAVKLASVVLVVTTGLATVVLEIFAPQTIAIFNDDAKLLAIGIPAMRIFMATLIFIGPEWMVITTFQGLSKGKEALILTLLRQFFFVPPLFLLPRVMGITGVWLSWPISDFLAFIASGFWILREYKVQKRSDYWLTASIAEADPKD